MFFVEREFSGNEALSFVGDSSGETFTFTFGFNQALGIYNIIGLSLVSDLGDWYKKSS